MAQQFEVPTMNMTPQNQFHELACLIRGLNGCLMEAAQEVADLRVDLQEWETVPTRYCETGVRVLRYWLTQ